MDKLKFSGKFYVGIVFIIVSLFVGKLTQVTFFLYFNNSFIRWLSVIIYVSSWPLLIIGVWWVGKEYSDAVKKYFSYKFYHQQLKKSAQTFVSKAKKGTHVLKDKANILKPKK